MNYILCSRSGFLWIPRNWRVGSIEPTGCSRAKTKPYLEHPLDPLKPKHKEKLIHKNIKDLHGNPSDRHQHYHRYSLKSSSSHSVSARLSFDSLSKFNRHHRQR